MWWSIVTGCLLDLTYSRNFVQQGSATPEEVSVVFRTMLDQFSFEGTCGDLPAGSIIMFGGSVVPDGWGLCDGHEVSRASFPELFTAIGTAYGDGDGLFTFNLPDMRQVSPMGAGLRDDYTHHVLGDRIGEEVHHLIEIEIPAHNHADLGHSHTESGAVTAVGAAITGVPVPSAVPFASVTGTSYAVIDNTGGDQPHNTVHPCVVVNYLIRL
jgi:microcystin-dependent protein